MKRDAAAPCQTTLNTGMAWSILSEITELLELLADKGQVSSIDLRSLPLTEADRDQLEALLGKGEIHASLDLMGRSEVWETAYAGAWWVRHMDAGGQVSSEEIAITRVPEILVTHPVDIQAAAERIRQQLETEPANLSGQEQEATHV